MSAYDPISKAEFDTHTTVYPGVRCLYDVIIWTLSSRGVTGQGIYNRRPIRGSKSRLTYRNASFHAVGRAADIGVPTAEQSTVGGELMMHLIHSAPLTGVQEVIFDGKRWDVIGGVKEYHGVDMHRTHVHWSMNVDFASHEYTPDLQKWFAAAVFG